MSGLWQFDQTVFRDINVGWHHNWLDPFFWILSSSGLGWVQVSTLILLLSWKVFTVEGARSFADLGRCVIEKSFLFIVLLTWAVTGILDQLSKQWVPRERPSDLAWSLPQEDISWRSFASGHTATSFGIAFAVLFLTWGTRRRGWGIFALCWAALVGLSRVYRGVHWPTDVISGFFVGLGSASIVFFLLNAREGQLVPEGREASSEVL